MANKDTKTKELQIEEAPEEKNIPVSKKRKFKVISYNPQSNTLVFERNSIRYQSNCIDYDGVSSEIELEIN